MAKAFCCENISLIENYELAVADQTQKWDCHHRNGIQFSRDELKAMGLYWKRPANELIFMTASEHRKMHKAGKNNPMYGKTGENAPNYGRHWSDETKNKLSEAQRGEKSHNAKAVYQIDKNTGEIIKIWKSISDAKRALDILGQNIGDCCRGYRKSAGGFIWRYVDEC